MTNSVYLRLDTFTRKRKGEKERTTYANYVAIPKELADILFKAVEEGIAKGISTTNRLEGCVFRKWIERSHLYGIHKDNPYMGEYYNNCSLAYLGEQIVWEKWKEGNLQLTTEYDYVGTTRSGVCCYDFLEKVDIFPLFTDKMPENAYLVIIAKPIRFENNTLYWDNGAVSVSTNNPNKTEYNRAFYSHWGVK